MLFNFKRQSQLFATLSAPSNLSFFPPQFMVVHLLAGRGRGCGPAPANIDRQQRSSDTVPQQLLRQVAQQFADSG